MKKFHIDVDRLMPTIDVKKYGYIKSGYKGMVDEENLPKLISNFMSNSAESQITITKSEYMDVYEDDDDCECEDDEH